jgi:hypothetical protein
MKGVNGCGCGSGLLKYLKPPYAKKFVWFSAGSMSSGTWYCTKANYNIVNGLVAN